MQIIIKNIKGRNRKFIANEDLSNKKQKQSKIRWDPFNLLQQIKLFKNKGIHKKIVRIFLLKRLSVCELAKNLIL